jgi:lysophospholipase L1-like esterase
LQDLDSLYPPSTIVISTHSDWTKSHYAERINEFKKNPLESNDIVFLGNSITEHGGDWGSRFNNSKVKNRGIAGDTTDGILARLGEIIYYKPSKVFILIGINDLFRNDMSSQKVFDNIISIVNKIKQGSSQTVIYVQTILPTTTESLKTKIQLTNSMLKDSESNESFKLISLHDHFKLDDDSMNMDFSTDGVHLNEQGYSIWTNVVSILID